jgi:hypothetical protein
MARRFNQLRSSKRNRGEVAFVDNALLYQFFDFGATFAGAEAGSAQARELW